MSDGIITELSALIAQNDHIDRSTLREHNIAAGLRDEQGAGIIVGATGKGEVIGYDREKSAVIKGEEDPKFPDAFVVDPFEAFRVTHGYEPDEKQLNAFIPKLRTILDFKKVPLPGKLFYCGYDIEDLVEAHEDSFGFEEVSFLLLTGRLPAKNQLEAFSHDLKERRALPDGYKKRLLYQLISSNMMNSLQTAVDNLYETDQNPNSTKREDVLRHSLELIAKFPTILAYAYHAMMQKYRGVDFNIIDPSAEYTYAEDFMSLFRAGKGFTRDEALTLDRFLMLHAEHGGGNNSTFTVRVVSSSETDTYSAISSGLASLKGHLHGGANEDVVMMVKDMQTQIKDWKDQDEIFNYLCRWVRKEIGDHSGKIPGFGHAVYTRSDPRTAILREDAKRLAVKNGRIDEFELLDISGSLAIRALKHVKGDNGKEIPQNVDFFSGFVLDCLGIPVELYTPLFATARVSGWCAHRLEQLEQNRIIRPAYFNVCPQRIYVPIEQR
jgi:citrate synthase